MSSDSDAVPDGDTPRDGASGPDESARSGKKSGKKSARGSGARSSQRSGSRESGRAPVGAAAGSARAAARASGGGSSVTPGKGRPTPSRNRGVDRPNIFVRIIHYLREVIGELRKVIWPTQNEMVTYSIVVVLFLIFMIAMTWGADFGFAKLIFLIFS